MADHTKSLLDRDIPRDYRQEWTEHVAEKTVEEKPTTESGVIFRVGTEWLCVATEWFQGIAEIAPIHSLPQRRDTIIMGLADVRGELMICISFASLLGISSNASSGQMSSQKSTDRFMVLRVAGGPLAFPVQEVHGIHHYSESDLRELPSTLAHAKTHYTNGVLNWDGKLVARLNDALLFETIAGSLS